MKNRFDVEPCMKHYGCMVDLLGRAGMVRQAYEFVKAMPVEPDIVMWRALLGACRIHGHEELGEEVGKILLQWEKRSARRGRGGCEDFIALSNMYASAERWEDVSTIRREMKKNTTGNRPERRGAYLDAIVRMQGQAFEDRDKLYLEAQGESRLPLIGGGESARRMDRQCGVGVNAILCLNAMPTSKA
ncbi:hypothetical protein ZIOFF_019739 [Zingiber officinale]|uniref:Pentatricopeptide repeat-containing protein n=1 Tax=Zingiber officinale TaxID=94328 RepID=A0A8J5LP65_ZINOF|nr:hypothetical protein ZIOFF_019739 [Zingiber officinale]